MSNNTFLELRARLFLLEIVNQKKGIDSFSDSRFKNETNFLESNGYTVKKNNSSQPYYAVTAKGLEFAMAQQ